jgi:CRISPR-associated protein Cmr3
MTLQTWIIEPRDSLIARDGKPFGANITHATSLDFPFPSTTTGGVRTRIGLNQNGIFDCPTNRLHELKEIEVRGALLVSLKPDDGEIAQFFLPSPADALLVQTENQKLDGKASVKRLLPLKLDNAITNMPNHLLPVGITKNDARSKPCSDIRFWSWDSLKNWLMDGKDIADKNLRSLGIKNLVVF